MANDNQNDIAAVGGFAVLACVIAMLALVVAIAKGGAPDAPKGVDGADLRLAVSKSLHAIKQSTVMYKNDHSVTKT